MSARQGMLINFTLTPDYFYLAMAGLWVGLGLAVVVLISIGIPRG